MLDEMAAEVDICSEFDCDVSQQGTIMMQMTRSMEQTVLKDAHEAAAQVVDGAALSRMVLFTGSVFLVLGIIMLAWVWRVCKGAAQEDDGHGEESEGSVDGGESPAARPRKTCHRRKRLESTTFHLLKFMGFDVEIDSCDYAMQFPLRGKSDSDTYWSLNRFLLVRWEKEVDGLDLATRAFRDPDRSPLASEVDLQLEFSTRMSTHEYHEKARALLAQLLVGPSLGFMVRLQPPFPGQRELLLKITIPTNEDASFAIRSHASNLRYSMPLSRHAYEQCGLERATNNFGKLPRAHAEFQFDYADCFEDFRHVDLIRLIHYRISSHINLGELQRQGVLLDYFAIHNFEEMEQLLADWANPRKWYQISSDSEINRVRDYFGEEVAWTFVWHGFFTYTLSLPAFLGAFAYLRRFVLSLEHQRYVQLAYACFMTVWVMLFNGFYHRKEVRLAQRWGMDGLPRSAVISSHYRKELDEVSSGLMLLQILGDILAFAVIGVSAVGNFVIQKWRVERISESDPMYWRLAAAVAVSAQILIIDALWRHVSRLIVDHENHKTRDQYIAAWVQRMFWPRLFNNFYPFVYLGFLKRTLGKGGCPRSDPYCLGELEINIGTYFMCRIALQAVGDSFLMAALQCKIWHTQWCAGDRVHFTYIQVQAESFGYDDQMYVNDWTEQILTYAFCACFSLVLPAIGGIALLTNLFEVRLVAHRNTCYLRRPIPTQSPGIGIWGDLIRTIEMLALFINLAFAVFIFPPLRDFSDKNKWLIFIATEHIMFIVQRAFQSKFMNVPWDCEDVREQNQEAVRRVFARLVHVPTDLRQMCEVPNIGPGDVTGSQFRRTTWFESLRKSS